MKIPQHTPFHIDKTLKPSVLPKRQFLKNVGKYGNDSAVVAISTSVVGVLLRPLLILFDKNTKKEDKQYAASWNFVLSTGIIALELLFLKNIKKNSYKIAERLFKKRNLKLSPEHLEGFTNWIKFIAIRSIVTAAVIVDTIYLERLLDKISYKLTGKPFMKRANQPQDEKRKKRQKILDNFLKYTALLVTGGAIINYVGKKTTGRSIVVDGLKDLGTKTARFLTNHSQGYRSVIGMVDRLTDKLVNRVYVKKQFFEKEAKLKDGWIPRNMLVNAVVRPIMALMVGQPYLAIRTFLEEIIGAGIVKRVGDPLVKYSISGFNKVFNPVNKEEVEGVKVIAGQVMRNIILLNVGVGLLNNKIDSKLLNMIQKIVDSVSKEDGRKHPDPLREWVDHSLRD